MRLWPVTAVLMRTAIAFLISLKYQVSFHLPRPTLSLYSERLITSKVRSIILVEEPLLSRFLQRTYKTISFLSSPIIMQTGRVARDARWTPLWSGCSHPTIQRFLLLTRVQTGLRSWAGFYFTSSPTIIRKTTPMTNLRTTMAFKFSHFSFPITLLYSNQLGNFVTDIAALGKIWYMREICLIEMIKMS